MKSCCTLLRFYHRITAVDIRTELTICFSPYVSHSGACCLVWLLVWLSSNDSFYASLNYSFQICSNSFYLRLPSRQRFTFEINKFFAFRKVDSQLLTFVILSQFPGLSSLVLSGVYAGFNQMRTPFELLCRYHFYLPYNHPFSLFATFYNQNVIAIMPHYKENYL
jgi:hypothetical protein